MKNSSCLIIAEAGVNHNGDIKKALDELDQLPSHLQNEIRDWYMDAKNRLEINTAINHLTYFHTD